MFKNKKLKQNHEMELYAFCQRSFAVEIKERFAVKRIFKFGVLRAMTSFKANNKTRQWIYHC